ncbi:hypothetical protein DKX38_021993 [Salix brachista]|uniref:Rhodanese domain-containing protein n=1 Tax=Salix brachista TaxID=2182728 RepID=A0A5N5K1R5_9ROSI|nr:hypothetical protein DKX38_021993 [Salix brachista]
MRGCSAACSAPVSLSTAKIVCRSKSLLFQFKTSSPFASLTTTSIFTTRRPFLSLSRSQPNEAKQKQKLWEFNCSTIPSSSIVENPYNDFVVVNFYRFVLINDPLEEVAKHLSFLKGLDIHGRIYVNEQGINAQVLISHFSLVECSLETFHGAWDEERLQYSGPSKDALAYVEWLREDFRFSDILVQISPALNGHAFPKLKLRYKPSLVQLEGGISHLPLLDPTMRATPLAPSEWRKRLKEVHDSNCVVLDVRNGYEWDIGHFHGAQRPDVDCFRSTSFGESNSEEAIASDPLANVDKEKTNILMYCTGGIRCDVYSTILRQRGFQNLYTLKGGVSHYLQNEGPVEWFGNLFVFDDRLSLPPSAYNPEDSTVSSSNSQGSLPPRSITQVVEEIKNIFIGAPHLLTTKPIFIALANITNHFDECFDSLNRCCMDCVKDFKGCCCLPCTSAPRLRPVLPGNQRYKKWYMYRELEAQSELTV